ncbi:MAG: hypothetical protein JOZ57_00775, partial [Abitibacteriaceae bacterium]|nr:hypothetical protein [Abditibacteriaceae bacterium]
MKRINRINKSGYLSRNDRTEAQNAAVTSGINRGPMALLSLGTFLIVVWLVILLPGQDIAAGQPRSQYQESQEQAAA